MQLLRRSPVARRQVTSLLAQPSTRSFASTHEPSSRSDGPLPKLGFFRYWIRCLERRDQYTHYQANGVFRDSTWPINNVLAFLTLQFPLVTQIDAVEFLEGVKLACKQRVTDSNSPELKAYVRGDVATSAVAARLQSYCTPGAYDKLVANVARNVANGMSSELQSIEVVNAALESASYRRLTEEQYEQENATTVHLPYEHLADQASIERLRLTACVTTNETHKVTMHEAQPVADTVVQQLNVYHCTFEACVNSPDTLSWRIAAMRGTNISAKKLEHKVVAA